MFLYKNSHISIFFGDAQNSIPVEDVRLRIFTPSVEYVAEQLHARQIVFLQQEHKAEGLYVQAYDDKNYTFDLVGDYIVTQKQACGLGVLTADCLPIVIYDHVTHAVAIVHAGWKGLVAQVVQKSLESMKANCHVKLENLEIYIGPAARACCYEVQQDFIDNFLEYQDYFDIIFVQKNDKTYFDSRAFVIVLARNLGINEEKIYTMYNLCTICNSTFCSYRREKEKARRQISMVCLH